MLVRVAITIIFVAFSARAQDRVDDLSTDFINRSEISCRGFDVSKVKNFQTPGKLKLSKSTSYFCRPHISAVCISSKQVAQLRVQADGHGMLPRLVPGNYVLMDLVSRANLFFVIKKHLSDDYVQSMN